MKVKLLKKLRKRYIIYKLHGEFFLDDLERSSVNYNFEGGFHYILYDSFNNIKSIRREWIHRGHYDNIGVGEQGCNFSPFLIRVN